MHNVKLLTPFAQHSVTVSYRLKVSLSILDFVATDSYKIQPIPEGVQRLRILHVCPPEGIYFCQATHANITEVRDIKLGLEVFYYGTGRTPYKPEVGQLCAASHNGNLCFLFNAVLSIEGSPR